MRRLATLAVFVCLNLSLQALTTTFASPGLLTASRGENTEITPADGAQAHYPDQAGAAAIPLMSAWVELPVGQRLTGAIVTPLDVKSTPLAAPPQPVQQPSPLLLVDDAPVREYSYAGVTPADYLSDSGWGRMGGHNLAWVALNAAQWDAATNTLSVPTSFEIEWLTAPDTDWSSRPETATVSQAMRSLGLRTPDLRTPPGYLVIAPAAWLDNCQELLEWRHRQGMRVFSLSVESIEATYPGADTQERLRNAITEYYLQERIGWVTLVGDVNVIPDRKLFAFDCEFGLYEDESDLPADMYYACLDGDWNADGDEFWGEDEDEPDWLPEVFIGRIPALNDTQLNGYIHDLLMYEKAVNSYYTHALGFSMNLWPGSQSYHSQQNLYDRYFPADWDINFLYGDANNTDDVLAAFADNPNIIQHTGHALWYVLALEDGHLYNQDFEDLPGAWCGTMYSIGCWSAALDRESIGEVGVCNAGDNHMLGYIGNSRYGWGAPGASCFGFSEFFQREFFRLLFPGNLHEIGALNTLQKLPFVPYYTGTSVYKWCAYELNALGDAAARIYTAETKWMDTDLTVRGDTLFVHAYGEGGAVANAVVTIGAAQTCTDAQGWAAISGASALSGDLSVWAPDFNPNWVSDFEVGHYQLPSVTDIVCDPEDFHLAQGETATLSATLNNPTQETIYYTVHPSSSSQANTAGEVVDSLAAGESVTLSGFEAHIRTVDEYQQQENGQPVWLEFVVMDTYMGETICAGQATLYIESPQLVVQIATLTDNYTQLALTLTNEGDRPASEVTGVFTCLYPGVDPPESFSLTEPLEPGQTAEITRDIFLPMNEAGHVIELELALSGEHNDQTYSFNTDLQLPFACETRAYDFESALGWFGDPAWGRVITHGYSGNHSLSCHPDTTGAYDIATPMFHYGAGQTIRFMYRYKMPMYGADGVYFILDSGGVQDTLLFLGSGGALPPGERDPQIYIEGDWAAYEIRIDEATLNPPSIDDEAQIVLRFNVGEYIEEFNAYADMPEVGVFIDDFGLYIEEGVDVEDEEIPTAAQMQLWPNPVGAQPLRVSFSLPSAGLCEAAVYNVRGQRVRTLHSGAMEAGEHELTWDRRNAQGATVSSGVYLVRMRTPQGVVTRKALLVR